MVVDRKSEEGCDNSSGVKKMARYTGPKCRLCRREGEKLFLKSERCRTGNKCPFDNPRKMRSYPPGEHGYMRRRVTDYRVQLREKQKVKTIYGILERQFRRYFYIADKQEGMTGENLLRILERRLDNIVFRSGFALTRDMARQIVGHGHILVNHKKVNIPSYLVDEGDVVSIKEDMRKNSGIIRSMELFPQPQVSWLLRREGKFEVKIDHLPDRDEMPVSVDEHLIVEFYSKV